MRNILYAALAALIVLTASTPALTESETSETYRQLDLFGEVFERVRANYVEKVSDKDLIEAAINGMLTSLDPHSSYLNEESFSDTQVQTRGKFGGLGIEVTMEGGVVKVVAPIDDTPAYRAGIKSGDLITHLDGEPVLGMTLNDAVDKMRGPVDTDIVLTIRREGEEPFDVTITRDIITIQSVRSRVEGDVGYLRITTFNEQAESGVEENVAKIKKELGDKLIGYVVDLRNNPGGLLDQAVAVADEFLDKGEIVSTRGRNKDDVSRFNARPGDVADGLPIVVLINQGSASASEIVAGALQDHRRAIIMGMQSFGKGSVQTIIPLPGHGAMRLTTARYYTPSGVSIQAKGITPDIKVPLAKIESLETKKGTREADLRGALEREDSGVESGAEKPANEKAPAAAPEETAPESSTEPEKGPKTSGAADEEGKSQEDYQLARAIDLLRGLNFYHARVVN